MYWNCSESAFSKKYIPGLNCSNNESEKLVICLQFNYDYFVSFTNLVAKPLTKIFFYVGNRNEKENFAKDIFDKMFLVGSFLLFIFS